MRIRTGSVVAIAAACLLAAGFSQAGYGQTQRLNCQPVDSQCLVSETPAPGVRIVRASNYHQRPAYYLSSNLYTTLAAGVETGNRFVAFDFQVPPGGGPLPHTHRNEWETFFVEEGTVTFTVGVEDNPPFNFIEQEVPAGTVVYGSLGPIHGFINKGRAPARIFSFAMPAGLENFFHVAGTEVINWFAPIPPITFEEIVRTAFWAEQRGDALHFPNTPAPIYPPGTLDHVISSVFSTTRPQETGPFGERRVVLLTPTEVGTQTGATAFCGPPPIPGRTGGTVKYSYFSLPTRTDFRNMHTSQNTEVFYTLGGSLTFFFPQTGNSKFGQPVTVPPLTFVQIEAGVPFTIGNSDRSAAAQALAISVIAPVCPPSPFKF